MSDPVAAYGASNILSPTGYSQTKLDDTHFKVTATGTEATPKERVEKIARARAAQIGVDQKLKYFKVAGVQHGVCVLRAPGGLQERAMCRRRAARRWSWTWSMPKSPTDPTFASTEEAYQTLSAELANEVVGPDAKAVAIQETRASCGKG